MNFWWVNQNQTSKFEISGGYLWSPKFRRDGGYNKFYENMLHVEVGNLVFSFYQQQIQFLGEAVATARSEPKPQDFGVAGDGWSHEGWLVEVRWEKVPYPYSPKDIIGELRPYLPKKYSPLQPDSGNGLQGVYLAEVSPEFASALLRPFGEFGIGFIKQITGKDVANEPGTDELAKARNGLGVFRSRVMTVETSCRITKVKSPSLLIASHIKPLSKCESTEERLDGNNGLLFTPHVAHFFDHGLISFSDNGGVLLSSHCDLMELALMGLGHIQNLNVGSFNKRQKGYLAYHRSKVFLK